MNERIKELAKQSGAWEYYEINEGVDDDEKPLEKFAELLVKECMSVARDVCLGDEEGIHGDTVNLVVAELTQHFGIKE
jgi:hypothetical protein